MLTYYYRITGWFIFSSKIETTKEKADGKDYRCIKWEEEVDGAKAFLGQRLVYEKGNITNKRIGESK